jgi:hypothetical protein
MNRLMRIAKFLTTLGLLSFSGFLQSASAGERLEYDIVQSNVEERVTIYVQGRQARILSSADQTAALIYNANHQQIHILDHANKTVTTIDQASLEQLASMAKGLGKIAKSQGGVLGDIFKTFGLDNELGESARIDVKTHSGEKSFSGQSCQMLQVFRNGELNTQICLTKNLRMESAERNTLNSLISFAQLLAREGQMVLSQFSLPIPLLPDESLKGTPIFVDDVASKTTATLIGFTQMDVLDRQFMLTEGYSKRVLSL